MYFPDLSSYCYRLPWCLDGVLTVGWLDPAHDYSAGTPDSALVERLHNLISRRTSSFDLHVNVVRGIHPCNLCGDNISLSDGTLLGMSEIWLPCGNVWLAAPSLAVHYIEAHDYSPPPVFADGIRRLDESRPVLSQSKYDCEVRNTSGGAGDSAVS